MDKYFTRELISTVPIPNKYLTNTGPMQWRYALNDKAISATRMLVEQTNRQKRNSLIFMYEITRHERKGIK